MTPFWTPFSLIVEMPLVDFRVVYRNPVPGMQVMLVRVGLVGPLRAYERAAIEQMRQWFTTIVAAMDTPQERMILDFRVTIVPEPEPPMEVEAPGTPPRDD